MKISEFILRLFFPPKCIVCDKLLDFFSTYPYCDECYAEMSVSRILQQSDTTPPNVNSLYVMYPYSNECVKHSVFHAKKAFSTQFKEFYRDSCKMLFEKNQFISDIDLITFVTRRKSEKRREGLDQSEEMAKIVSDMTGIPYAKTLIRTRKSKKQRLLSHAERAENVKGVFKSCYNVTGKHILLLDDVKTTGSTLSECADALKKDGAKRISVLVFSS